MRHPITVLIALPLLLAALLAPAVSAEESEGECHLVRGADTPDDPSDDVEVCRQQVWFTDTGLKAGNLAATDASGLPSWNTTEPTTSVTGGAGGGYLGSSLWQVSGAFDPAYTPAFEGVYDGDLETVLVDLYLFPMSPTAIADGMFRIDANLYYDDVLLASHNDLTVPLESGGDAVSRVRFAFRNLYRTLDARNLAGQDAEVDVRLEVVGTAIAGSLATWVYDTTEVPAGMVFNATDEELEGILG